MPDPPRFTAKEDASLSTVLRCRILNLIDAEAIIRPQGGVTSNYPAWMRFYAPSRPGEPRNRDIFGFEVSGDPVPGYPDIKVLEGELSTASQRDEGNETIQYTVAVRGWFRDSSGNKVLFRGSEGEMDVTTESIFVTFTTSIWEMLDNTYNRDAVMSLLKLATQAVFDEHAEKLADGDQSAKVPVYGRVNVKTCSL
jgi:hypothetical protein